MKILVRKIRDFGVFITRVGEKLGIPFLVYNPIIWSFFFVTSRREGRVFAKTLLEIFPGTKSTLDVGAGGCGYVYWLKKSGLNARGIEYAWIGRFLGKIQGVKIAPFDCSDINKLPVYEPFDITYTIEVGEHIPECYADTFVRYLCSTADTVIFSAAHPGQKGHGHINEQPKKYWENLFSERGFSPDYAKTIEFSERLNYLGYRGWCPKNMIIFCKA